MLVALIVGQLVACCQWSSGCRRCRRWTLAISAKAKPSRATTTTIVTTTMSNDYMVDARHFQRQRQRHRRNNQQLEPAATSVSRAPATATSHHQGNNVYTVYPSFILLSCPSHLAKRAAPTIVAGEHLLHAIHPSSQLASYRNPSGHNL